jgi:hypothetical protein
MSEVTAKLDASKAVNTISMTVELTKYRRTMIRGRIAVAIIKLACWIGGYRGVEVYFRL